MTYCGMHPESQNLKPIQNYENEKHEAHGGTQPSHGTGQPRQVDNGDGLN